MTNQDGRTIITAAEVANYVVCPEAWRLKNTLRGAAERQETERNEQSREIRKAWVDQQDLSSKLRRYAKIAYLLLFALVITVFVWEHKRGGNIRSAVKPRGTQPLDESLLVAREIPSEILYLLLVLGLIIFMWDLFDRRSKSIQKDSGLGEKAEAISVRGSSQLPAKEYQSATLGLASKPQAVIRDEGSVVPVDIYPLAKKVHDRHVVPLFIHMRLMEEIDGVRPPYGLLLMGAEQRRVKIQNSEDKQRWVETLVDEMHSILEGVPAVPSPSKYKCMRCDVRGICKFSLARNESNKE